MADCKECTCNCSEPMVPTVININITFNDNRMDEDASTYVEHVLMEGDSDGNEIILNEEE